MIDLADRAGIPCFGSSFMFVFNECNRLALKLEPLYAAKAKERQVEGGRVKVPQKSAEPKTRDRVAKIAGVSLM
jgi:hypothetical protein